VRPYHAADVRWSRPARSLDASARSGGIGALTAACVIAYALDWQSPIRTILGIAFLLLAPGLAVAENLRVRGVVLRLAFAPAISLALGTLIGTSLVYAGAYTPASALYALAILTIGLIALSLIPRSSSDGPSSESRSSA
jgi:uncharacterized membrane protein